MRDFHEFESNSPQGDAIPGGYMVCVGGYPREAAPTFAQAEARAWDLLWFEPDGDFSIYEVETGIHYNVPRAERLDQDVTPGVLDAFFERVHDVR